jgi:protein ImuB
MNNLPELYGCLYVRELPAQALLRLRPDLIEKLVKPYAL